MVGDDKLGSDMLDLIPQLLMNSLITGSIYALASAGLALSFGVLRILNFAHGHLMMLGAYIFLFFYARMNLPLLVAGMGTAVTMTVVALACLRVFVTPFAKINPLLPLITTIALGSMLEALVSIFFGVNVQSLTQGSFHDSMEFGGVYFTVIQLVIIGSAMVVFPLLGILIHVSPLGRAVAAITESREIATALGMRDKWIVRGCLY